MPEPRVVSIDSFPASPFPTRIRAHRPDCPLPNIYHDVSQVRPSLSVSAATEPCTLSRSTQTPINPTHNDPVQGLPSLVIWDSHCSRHLSLGSSNFCWNSFPEMFQSSFIHLCSMNGPHLDQPPPLKLFPNPSPCLSINSDSVWPYLYSTMYYYDVMDTSRLRVCSEHSLLHCSLSQMHSVSS